MQCNHIGMSTDEIKLDGTIFDYDAWGKYFNSPDKETKNSQFKVIYYALTIILQVINLIFLFVPQLYLIIYQPPYKFLLH